MANAPLKPKPKEATKKQPVLQAADVRAIFGMEPTDVVGYLKSKGLAITWDWHQVLDDLHAQVFTVAKVTKLDVLQTIQDALQTAMEEGQPFKKFVADLKPALQKKGWWGKAIDPETGEITPKSAADSAAAQYGSTRRLWTIYQTNLQSAFMAGRYKAMMAATDTHPYWMYVAVRDSRTRKDHAALSGRVYRFDDAFWRYFYPPNGYNCRCRVMPVSDGSMRNWGLTARNSADEPIHLGTVTVGKGEQAKQATQASFATTSSATGKRTVVYTDPSFAFNVGEAAWQPEAQRWRGPTSAAAKTLIGAMP